MVVRKISAVLVCIWLVAGTLWGQTTTVSVSAITDLAKQANDSVYVINFWATWCRPCIEEIPHFLAIDQAYANTPLAIKFVSVNRPNEMDKVNAFWQPYRANQPIDSWLLHEKDPNYFIPAIAEEWSGAIPATLIYVPQKEIRHFYEQAFTCEDLHTIIEPLIK